MMGSHGLMCKAALQACTIQGAFMSPHRVPCNDASVQGSPAGGKPQVVSDALTSKPFPHFPLPWLKAAKPVSATSTQDSIKEKPSLVSHLAVGKLAEW